MTETGTAAGPGNLAGRIALAVNEEMPLEGEIFANETVAGFLAEKAEFCRLRFEKCRFEKCYFAKASFLNVEFLNCDFSNCMMEDTYWKMVSFVDCKGQGANFTNGVFRNVKFTGCKLDYANFTRALWENLEIRQTTFVSASLSEVKLKKILLEGDRFEKTDFFKTPLKGVDFSRCDVEQLILSDDLREIRGAKLSPEQAVDIARLLGVTVV